MVGTHLKKLKVLLALTVFWIFILAQHFLMGVPGKHIYDVFMMPFLIFDGKIPIF